MHLSKPCLLALPLAVWLSAGCLSAPAATRYLLEPAAVGDSRAMSLPLESLGLSTVTLPGYVKDTTIVSRGVGVQLMLDDSAYWAEVPNAAVTRVLAESLRIRGGTDVLVEPLPRGFDPGARIEVGFDQLLGDGAEGVDLSGQVRLISGDGRRLLEILPFQLSRRSAGPGQEAFFVALSQALDDLASLIVMQLGGEPA